MASKADTRTDQQRRIQRVLGIAEITVLAYAAPTVPSLDNLTVEGMVEELGYLNEARKQVEKTEKIVKERLKSRLQGLREVRSDNFTMKLESVPRVALDQTKAKEVLSELGRLEECMSESEVERMTFSRNGG